MLTEEQLEQRLGYITGSDAGTICGVNPYQSAVELWQLKTRRAIQKDISDKPAVKAGNMLEDAVAKWFEADTGHVLIAPQDFRVHPTIEFMGGNIDRFLMDESAILECKTTQNEKGWGAGYLEGDNTIPDHYLCQVIHYCAVANVEAAYIAVLIRGIDFRWFKYERDLALEKKVIDRLTDFWVNHIVGDRAPDAQTADDILTLRPDLTDECAVADADISETIATLKETKTIIKGLEETQRKMQDLLCVFLNDRQTLVEANGKVAATWKQRAGSKRFDARAFRDKYPGLYEQFEVTGDPVRTFLLK
jgi:putative phage-type endonuclease